MVSCRLVGGHLLLYLFSSRLTGYKMHPGKITPVHLGRKSTTALCTTSPVDSLVLVLLMLWSTMTTRLGFGNLATRDEQHPTFIWLIQYVRITAISCDAFQWFPAWKMYARTQRLAIQMRKATWRSSVLQDGMLAFLRLWQTCCVRILVCGERPDVWAPRTKFGLDQAPEQGPKPLRRASDHADDDRNLSTCQNRCQKGCQIECQKNIR